MSLIKSLPKIAAKELKNTHCGLRNLKYKLELIAAAYTTAAVERDFTLWCQENVDQKFKYPIFEYMKVIDSRLGSAPEEKRGDTKDPHVSELASLSYEMTGVLPAASAVADLLLTYPFDEIKAALTEYAENLTEREMRGAMRAFYSEGGAGAVILARRRRTQK